MSEKRLFTIWILSIFLGLCPSRSSADMVDLPRTIRNGDLFIARVPAGKPAPEAAELLGIRYPALAIKGFDGRIFLIGVDLETPPGDTPFVLHYPPGAGEPARQLISVAERTFPTERLTLPSKMVTPPAEVQDRIAAERRRAAAIYRTSTPERLWEPPFTRSSQGTPSGNFGRRRILNDLPRSPHSGEDYAAPRGDEVRATARGKVRLAADLYYSGLTVLIDHGAGLVSQYFHLDEIAVSEGDIAERGQAIGKVGSTGRVTGPHLHFGLRLFEQRVDPAALWNLFPP